MPTVSKKQHDAMCGAAHSPQMAKQMGVPQKVAKEMCMADMLKKHNAKPVGK